MARASSISTDQVNSAANYLVSQGVKPTARAVRERLGGGSMPTVLRLLQSWQSTQAKTSVPVISLPADLEQILLSFVGREVAGAKGMLEAELASLKQAHEDLIDESERQEHTIVALQKNLDESSEDRANLAGRLAQMEIDLANARDAVTKAREAAEHARTELAKSLLRLESMPRLEADVDRARGDLETERAVRVESEQLAAVLQARLDGVETAHKKLDAQHTNASIKLLDLSTAHGDERVARHQADRRLADKEAALLTANELVNLLQENLKISQLEAATLTGRLQEQTDPGVTAKATNSEAGNTSQSIRPFRTTV